MQSFVKQSNKGGTCGSFNQNQISIISDELFNTFSKELDVNGYICKPSDEYFEFTIKQKKMFENEYDSQFEDYRDINEDEISKNNYKKLGKLTIHEKLQKLQL